MPKTPQVADDVTVRIGRSRPMGVNEGTGHAPAPPPPPSMPTNSQAANHGAVEEQTQNKPEVDPIKERQAANASLRNSPRFNEDLNKAQISSQQLEWMQKQRAPLGFKNPAQYQQFRADLMEALSKSGLDDAKVGVKGTATTFYSENPGKPLGHFWDADPANPGDYDLNLASNKMAGKMNAAGVTISPRYGIYRTKDINSQFPHLQSFSAKWRSILGREVNIVGYQANTSPVRDASEFILVK